MALQNISQLLPSSFQTDSLMKSLSEEFVLCENGNMVFHWADFYETCDLIKSQLDSSPLLMSDFKNRALALKRLEDIPIWVRDNAKIHQFTMYELYEKYILNQARLVGGVDPFSSIEISFISGTGPFKGMSIAECFNQSTYRDFVLVYLIEGKLPKRDFRIRLKSKILMEFGEDFKQAQLVSLEQLTINGLLFSIDSDIFRNEISQLNNVRMLLDSQMLENGIGMGLPELKVYLSQFAFNLLYSSRKEDALVYDVKNSRLQSSFDFSRSKKAYLFLSFDNLKADYPATVKSLQDFVIYTKDLIRSHYQQQLQKSKSA